MNEITLIGRLTRDVEMYYAANNNNTAIARYTLAVNRPFKQNGEQQAGSVFQSWNQYRKRRKIHMTYELAKQFWRVYIGMVSKNGAVTNLINPAIDFTARAKNGEYDNLSDDEYGEKVDDIRAVSTFWEDSQSQTVGNILLNALAKTNLSDAEVDEIACVLADASRSTDYVAMKKENQEYDEGLLNPDLDFSPEISGSSHTPPHHL